MKCSFLQRIRHTDRRLWAAACIPAALFAVVTVVGNVLNTHGAFPAFAWGGFAVGAALCVLLFVLYAAALWLLFWLFDAQRGKAPAARSLFDRISGNGVVMFILLAACWIPAWLAFWPGQLPADSLTQFYVYYNEDFSAHHPLLHTLFLGSCMMAGIDAHPEGYADYGLALYCGIQLLLVAVCVAFALNWLKRRGAPLWARLVLTLAFALFPYYALWPIYPQKDVLFAALALVFCLNLADLWRFGMKPLRMVFFVLVAVLMMLFRHNGAYALVLLIPLAMWLLKGMRVRVGVLLVACLALYTGADHWLKDWLWATDGETVEILSIPLQQMARTLRDDPSAASVDEEGLLNDLYDGADMGAIYTPAIADPIKWNISYAKLEENVPKLLGLWAKMGAKHLDTYVEAFMVQNLPYILPGAKMLCHFDLGVHQIDEFPIEGISRLPALRRAYMEYDRTLRLWNIPHTELLSDTAVMVWLCMAGLAYALCRRERGFAAAFGFLLCIWFTCLLGPVAIMRYMLTLFYAVPVLLCAMLAHEGKC